MKKILLSALAISICIGSYAQSRYAHNVKGVKITPSDKAVPAIKTFIAGNEIPVSSINPVTAAQAKHSSPFVAPVPIGFTSYDLQSNASVGNRCLNVNGNVYGTWTSSISLTLAAPDRGSGYNLMPFGGSWGTPSSTKIEPIRTGWPSIALTAAGSEHVTSHISGKPLFHAWRTVAGTGVWDTASLPSIGTPEVLWGRMAAGGNDGNSLHSICITLPLGNAGALYNGLDGCPIYQRSQDNGVTWDITNMVPPGVDSTNYFGWSADAYAIDAKGSTVAIVHGQIDEDWCMWKSTDNGTTWTKTVIMDFPFIRYDDTQSSTDIDGDGVGDTILTVDHKVSVLVDNNGMVHCWAGALLVLDVDVPSLMGLFLSTDGLMYWNESMGASPPAVIATTPDIDGVPGLTFAADYVPRYGNGGQTTMPDAAIDGTGNMVVSFVTPIENTTSGNPSPIDFSYRQTWMIGSSDGGSSWGTPVCVTGDVSQQIFAEAVFTSISRDIIGSCIDMVWQEDGAPGIAVQPPITGDQSSHPFSQNDIFHNCTPLPPIVSVQNNVPNAVAGISVYPNPANDFVNLSFTTEGATTIEVDIYNVNGQKVDHIIASFKTAGNQSLKINTDKYSSGIYSVNAKINETVYNNKFVVK